MHVTWTLNKVRGRPRAAGEKEFLTNLRAYLAKEKELEVLPAGGQQVLEELIRRNQDAESLPTPPDDKSKPPPERSGGR